MAIQIKSKQIGAHTYQVAQLGALEGRKTLLSIVRILGTGLAAALSGAGSGNAKAVEELIARGAGDALSDVLQRLDEREVMAILDQLAQHTTVVVMQGKERLEPSLKDIFDQHFAGAYDEMLGWARFALEVNFASFFGGSSGFTAAAKRLMAAWKAKSASASPGTSTGTSGESSPPSGSPAG